MRAVLVHNPASGANNYDKSAILAALKLADIQAEYVSAKRDDIERSLKKDVDLVIAAGGDGTIRKVVEGARRRGIPLAILPLGTANNVARSLGIAGTPQELVETWDRDHTVPLDVGLARGAAGTRVFIESFGVGLLPLYLQMAAKSKKREGAENLQHGRELLQKALKKAKPIDIAITADGKKLSGDFLGVEVLNIPFTGPGLPLGARADAADGKLDIVCFEAERRKELIEWLDAPLDSPPPVSARKGCAVCITWRDAPNRLDDASFDNEDKTLTAEITCEEATVCVLIPRKLPAQKVHERKAAAS